MIREQISIADLFLLSLAIMLFLKVMHTQYGLFRYKTPVQQQKRLLFVLVGALVLSTVPSVTVHVYRIFSGHIGDLLLNVASFCNALHYVVTAVLLYLIYRISAREQR